MQELADTRVVLDFLTDAASPDDDMPGLDRVLADAHGAALKIVIPIDDLPACRSREPLNDS